MRNWKPGSIANTVLLTLISPIVNGSQWVISQPVVISTAANKAPDQATESRDNQPTKIEEKVVPLKTSGVSTGDPFEEDEFQLQEFKRWQGWFNLLYDSGNRHEVSGVKGFSVKSAGLVIGADAEMDKKTRVGAAFTFDRATVNGDDSQKTKIKGMLGSFYTRWDNRLLFLNTMMTLGKADSEIDRMMGSTKYTGKYKAGIWSVNITAGKHTRYQGWNIDPMALFNYSSIDFKDYVEKTEAGDMTKKEPSSFEAMEFGLGIKVNRSYWGNTLVRRGTYKPEFSLVGLYDVNSNGSDVKSRFSTGGDSFVITSPKRDKFRLKGELGITVNTYRRWTLKAGYRFHWSSNYNAHGVSAQVNYLF